jgi:RNA-directed DNA polymerase
MGGPQGGPCSPLTANSYLNDLDWPCERLRQETEDSPYDALNDRRFADDIIILVSHYWSK